MRQWFHQSPPTKDRIGRKGFTIALIPLALTATSARITVSKGNIVSTHPAR
jgi:hypothetical protein